MRVACSELGWRVNVGDVGPFNIRYGIMRMLLSLILGPCHLPCRSPPRISMWWGRVSVSRVSARHVLLWSFSGCWR